MSVELVIDGLRVSGRPGQTILEVARENGIDIPTLCYHPYLKPSGACRICVVDVGRPDRLMAACTTPISHGMVVETRNPRVLRARRLNLELLLSDHKQDCLVCEMDGACILQDLAYELGLEEPRFTPPPRRNPPDKTSPAIQFDPDLCVKCGRCVSACNQVRGHDVLTFAGRGYESRLVADLGVGLGLSSCVSCGECVEYCPTGALTEKPSRFQGRWRDLKPTKTTCPYCGVGCTLTVYTRGQRLVKVRGDLEGPENRGSLCVKGRFGFDWVNSPHRLTTPLVRGEDGRLQEASWEEALGLVARKLGRIRDEFGPNAVYGLASAKCTNEENYLFQKFMRAVIGTNNVDHCARLCHAPTVAGLVQAFGSGAMTNSIQDLGSANCFLVIGSNTTENHPVIAKEIIKAVREKGASLIVADPRKIGLVRFASVWLRHRPGTDVALLNGLMNVIIQEGLHDEGFIESRTEGFHAFREAVSKYTPERVERITGVPAGSIVEAARLYASGKPSSIVFSMGITQHTTGTANVLSCANLAMLTGNIGKPGSGVNPLRGQNNVQGACDMGCLPDVYPGYRSVEDPETASRFQEAWGVPLSREKGLTLVEAFNAAGRGDVRAMYIMGENPMLSEPHTAHVEEALKALDFLVVQDVFLTETAQLADVVLPSCSFAEKEGTYTNTARRVQRVRQAIQPIGGSLPDWEIICRLAQKMGYPMHYQGPAAVMEEIALLTPIYGGISYPRLEGEGLQWPCPEFDHPGTPILHRNRFTRGLGRFHVVEHQPPDELTDDEYPLILTTGRILQHFHTGTMTRRSQVLDALVPRCPIEVNPEDAQELGVTDGSPVRVKSRRGEVEGRVVVTPRSPRGVVFIPFHFAETAANRLTNPALDPISKIPELKVCAVRLEKS